MRNLVASLFVLMFALVCLGSTQAQDAIPYDMAGGELANHRRLQGATPSNDPRTVYGSNLKAWYDPSDLSTVVKGGYLFNSTGNRLLRESVPAFPFTVAFWLRPGTVCDDIVHFDAGDGTTWQESLWIAKTSTTNIRVSAKTNTGPTESVNVTGANAVWQLVVVVVEAAQISAYTTATPSGATGAVNTIPPVLTRMWVGGTPATVTPSNPEYHANSRIGPLVIYNRALDATDRARLFALEDPRSLAGGGPVDYYPMDGNVKTATAGGSDLTVVGSPTAEQNVIIWRDKSGNGQHLSASTGRPVYTYSGIGGRGSIDMERDDTSFFRSVNPISVSDYPYTVYAVAQNETLTGNQGIFDLKGANNHNSTLLVTSSQLAHIINDGGGSVTYAASCSVDLDTPYLARLRCTSSTDRDVRRGTGWYGTNKASRSPTVTFFVVGAYNNSATSTFDGYLGEIILTSATPTDQQDVGTVSYLDRWGLGLAPIKGWTPSSLGSGRLAAHYQPSGIQTTGDSVTSWQDSGPNGWHLTDVSSPAPQSASHGTINQRRAVQFSAANSTYLSRDVASGLPDNNSGVGVYAVVCQTIESNSGTASFIGDKDVTTSQMRLLGNSTDDGCGWIQTGTAGSQGVYSASTDATDKSKINLWFGGAKSGSDYCARLNDLTPVTRSTTNRPAENVDRVTLGAGRPSSGTTSPITASIPEAVILAGFPTDSEDAQLRAYLGRRYRYSEDGTNGRQWNPYQDLQDPTAYIGLAMDATRSDTITESGGVVSGWKDALNRPSLSFTQGTESLRPSMATVNALQAVDFDGSDDYLRLAAAPPFAADTSGYVVAAIQFDDDPGANNRAIFSSSDEATSNYSLQVRASNTASAASSPSVFQVNNDTADNYSQGLNPTTGTVSVFVVGSTGSAYLQSYNAITPTAGNNRSGSDTGDWFGDTPNLDNAVLGAVVTTSATFHHNGKVVYLFYVRRPMSTNDPVMELLRAWMGNTTGAF